MVYDNQQYYNDMAAERDYLRSRCCVHCYKSLQDESVFCDDCGNVALQGDLEDYPVECDCCNLMWSGQVRWIWTHYRATYPNDLGADITCPACKEENE